MAAMDGLGAALASLRKERKLTQTELARRAEVTRGNLSLYESDSVQPRLDTLSRILGVLDVDLMSLAQRMREVSGVELPEGVGQWQADATAFLVVPLRRGSHESGYGHGANLLELGARYAAHIVDELFPGSVGVEEPTQEEGPQELLADGVSEERS